MEAKKSRKADLERGWFGRFALGLIVALSCMFVGLNYSVEPDDPLDDPDLLDMFSMDEDLSSLMRPENELELAPKAEPEPAKKLVVADEEKQSEPLSDDEPVETDMNNDMSALDDEEQDNSKPEEDEVISFRVVEDLPQFPGGAVEMMKWLQRNLKYPPVVQERKIQGKVVAEFIVNKDGSLTDFKVVKSLNSMCDREVLRVLRMMPRWTAGVQNDQPCRTKVCIPVVFKM
ncbi:TonB family protein [Prevotella sp. E15-22]|uniref:energy transducer TonB n=1 Tax=Prevotella sp. E15-22 TaxID=2937774 RepID=UPI0020664C33|nr:energy transducer TonB [Prevotella sp. E15-22]UPS43769.1 TonB family protein [Prevotella sp. E15-22]